MDVRSRFHALMRGEPVDRLPVLEWAAWWYRTIERWHAEGLPADCTDRYDICRHFGLDVHVQFNAGHVHWDTPYRAPHHGAGLLAAAGADPAAILQDIGRWPVIPDAFEPHLPEHHQGSLCLWFSIPGFFALPRTVFGIERHLFAFYDEPDLMHEINDRQADWACRYIEELCTSCQPDFMSFMEDMSYNHGPMLSQELWDEFIAPYYHRVVPVLKKHGIWSFIDSDGDIGPAAAWFTAAGVDGVFPLERQAGVDVAQLRREHPDLRLLGGYDKLVMHRGEAAIRAEFERLLPAAQAGGLIASCDHQTPPAVGYEDYRCYVRCFHDFARAATRQSVDETAS